MDRQLKLVLLLAISLGCFQIALLDPITAKPLHLVTDDISDNELSEEDVKDYDTTTTTKIQLPNATTTTSYKKPSIATSTSTTTMKPIKEEYLNDLIEASHHSLALADDPRFNKMLPEKFKMENSTAASNKTDDLYSEYEYDYAYDEDEDYDYTENPKNVKDSKAPLVDKFKKVDLKANLVDKFKKVEMKPIEDHKKLSKTKDAKKLDHSETSHLNDDQDDTDEYDDEDEEDDDEEIDSKLSMAEPDIVFSENVPCPRYCVCARNINSYMVATCSRLDLGTQKFGSDITDLLVTDVGPKYPIVLGPEIFLQLGLKHVSSIKIANCTVEYIHHSAFNGLEELYAVNLTNVGLSIFNPDTFVNNKKLRMLTISGNDLNVMSTMNYLLKSSTIEELDLSRNNLAQLDSAAFSKLSNVVYINLGGNNLEQMPEDIFNNLETIEELDLSFNRLKSLPVNIFNRTALGILRLKYNDFSNDLSFGNNDLQQLDLSFNNIQHVHHGMFDKMTSLNNLNLKSNGITKIQPDSFLTLTRLRHIDLSFNDLDQISTMVFYKNSELDVIRLNDNPKLTQLPTDGFLCSNGYFTVYLLDLSNCAIGALGHKTFSTMPHLSTLKLAWNNINNLERDTFQNLTKLTDLDLSNNLITRVDELLFMNNNDIVKLNLAGNPIRTLSVRIFLPMTKLRDLDVSECDLISLLSDTKYGIGHKYRFYDTLRSFNASHNQINSISAEDVKSFKNLRTLDIGFNPLQCNEGFQSFIRHVLLNTEIVPKKVPMMAEMRDEATQLENEPPSLWAHVAKEVCGHHVASASFDSKAKELDARFEKTENALKQDSKNLMNMLNHNDIDKMHVLKDSRKTTFDIVDKKIIDEESVNNASEDKDDDEDESEDEYDEDDDEEEQEQDIDGVIIPKKAEKKTVDFSKFKDHGVIIEEIQLQKEVKDKFLRDKLLPESEINNNEDDDENDDDEEDDEDLVEREIYIDHQLRSSILGVQRNVVLFTAVFVCFAVMFAIFVKCIYSILQKRGERHHMALMMSKKNSIVYQKLTEDIKPPVKETKQPKVHRYAPINLV